MRWPQLSAPSGSGAHRGGIQVGAVGNLAASGMERRSWPDGQLPGDVQEVSPAGRRGNSQVAFGLFGFATHMSGVKL